MSKTLPSDWLILMHHETSYPAHSSIDDTPTPATSHILTSLDVLNNPVPLPVPHIIDVDAIGDHGLNRPAVHTWRHTSTQRAHKWPCNGLPVTFPDGKDQHTSYPFSIHSEHSVPWDY